MFLKCSFTLSRGESFLSVDWSIDLLLYSRARMSRLPTPGFIPLNSCEILLSFVLIWSNTQHNFRSRRGSLNYYDYYFFSSWFCSAFIYCKRCVWHVANNADVHFKVSGSIWMGTIYYARTNHSFLNVMPQSGTKGSGFTSREKGESVIS